MKMFNVYAIALALLMVSNGVNAMTSGMPSGTSGMSSGTMDSKMILNKIFLFILSPMMSVKLREYL
jgi:hypothetical protein